MDRITAVNDVRGWCESWDHKRAEQRHISWMGTASKTGHELLTENLRRLSERGRIPLTVIADRAGIDRAELFAAMSGEYDPDLDWLLRLAEALSVPLSELFEEPGGR